MIDIVILESVNQLN